LQYAIALYIFNWIINTGLYKELRQYKRYAQLNRHPHLLQ
jgi:hypothetical protein